MNLLGEYPVSIDSKARLRVPTGLLKQLGVTTEGAGFEFVVNKGFEGCLNLYPKVVWDEVAARVNQLNSFNQQHRLFSRTFFSGAYPTATDSADRILLQKPMMEYAGLEGEAILLCMNDKIEIWSPAVYEKWLNENEEKAAELADVVLGGGNGIAKPEGEATQAF